CRSRARRTASAGPPSSSDSPVVRCVASTATRSTRSTAAEGSASVESCATRDAFYGGEGLSLDEFLGKVASFQPRYVCVTGGEPLAQKGCFDLLRQLCDAGHRVSLETSGAIDISKVDPRVIRVVDVKTPGSAEEARNRLENLE